MTEFLGTWQGVFIALIVCAAVVAVIVILLKNVEAVKGLRVSKDGIRFDTVDLASAIPRIDSQVKVKLQCVVKDIAERARASIGITAYACKCPDDDTQCLNAARRVKILKMLLVQTMMAPLYDSIARNHLIKAFSNEGLAAWIKRMVSEIHSATLIIEDYCGIDLPDDELKTSVEKILKDFYVPAAQSILLESVYAKREVYSKLHDSDKRKERFLEKCDKYIAGLN